MEVFGAIAEPYMAAIHNENVAKYGPGVLVADRLNTNITTGVDSRIPRIITLDQLSPGHAGITASVGEAVVFPWNGSHADYRSSPEGTDDPERFMRDHDNSTLVFDPALPGSPRR